MEIKLTEIEKTILENLKFAEAKNMWLARDKNGYLYVHYTKPKKEQACWFGTKTIAGEYGAGLIPFSHLFQFVKWEDKEAYSVKQLLKNMKGVKHGRF